MCCRDASAWAERETVRQWQESLIGIGRQIMDVAFGALEEAASCPLYDRRCAIVCQIYQTL